MTYTLVTYDDYRDKRQGMTQEDDPRLFAAGSHLAGRLMPHLKSEYVSRTFTRETVARVHKKNASHKPKLRANAVKICTHGYFAGSGCSRQPANTLLFEKKAEVFNKFFCDKRLRAGAPNKIFVGDLNSAVALALYDWNAGIG